MLTPTEALGLAKIYAAVHRIAVSTVGKRAIGNHKIFGRIAAGHSANARTLQMLEAYFRANWPPTAPWPADIVPGPDNRRSRKCANDAIYGGRPT
jgi:hypothetical protein